MKLIKIVSLLLECSRRKAQALISEGLVCVNGQVISSYSFEISDKEGSELPIKINGKDFVFSPDKEFKQKYSYLAFYKPRGVEVSMNRAKQATDDTFIHLVSPAKRGKQVKKKENTNLASYSLDRYIQEIGIPNLKYAGRLDKDSEGLLILSNDGNFINEITHPRFSVQKTYQVTLEGLRSREQEARLREIFKVISLRKLANEFLAEIELKEGKNRQIRRGCASIGLTVVRLKRIRIGNLFLEGLKSGEFKEFDPAEIKMKAKEESPGEGFEPPTKRLTAARSTTELPRNRNQYQTETRDKARSYQIKNKKERSL